MTDEEKLEALRMDLGLSTTAYNGRLEQLLRTAEAEIERESVTLTDSVADGNLVVQYAAWMWRKRDTGDGLPRMIRWQINNRIFGGDSDG
ncbi:MAG: hypothetical protein IKF75_01690 [Lachnospiraceae bacterium]|nr:hypothetical protein [Lachnospiraceae bacterium]